MEGIFLKEMLELQQQHLALVELTWTIPAWTKCLLTKVLEITHNQWWYRIIHIHDATTRTHVVCWK